MNFFSKNNPGVFLRFNDNFEEIKDIDPQGLGEYQLIFIKYLMNFC